MNILDSSSSPALSGRGAWHTARRLLLAAAALATLIAVFYTIENWRGKRAWANCRRELEAKGEVLDWATCIPGPVPDDRNFFKAPKMREWLVKDSLRDLVNAPMGKAARPFSVEPRQDAPVVLAEVQVKAASGPVASPQADAVLESDDPSVREQLAKLIGAAIGPCAIGARGCVLVGRPVTDFKPLHLVLQANTSLKLDEVAALFLNNPLTNSTQAWSGSSYLRVHPRGTGAFRVSLEPVFGAEDYLAWTEPVTADLDLVRKALERPFARLDGDYQQPYAISVPNFINIRQASQILAQRAQSHLLLGQSEAAWHELALVRDLCRILEPAPTGKPMTLVAAMINVAVAGLYAGVVEDGVRLHAWGEPHLLAIERQLQKADLLAPVVEAFREERAATCLTFETTKPGEIANLFSLGDARQSWRDKLGDAAFALMLRWMPRGWFYQNMAVGGRWEQEVIDSVDLTNRLVRPARICEMVRNLSSESKQRAPYSFLVRRSFPNFAKALETTARNQTLLSQAGLACALERYRLARGRYPETLDALTPDFIEKLPHDLINGEPLKYRQTGRGGYLLWSVGWDRKDDGGVSGKSREDGDWVWELR